MRRQRRVPRTTSSVWCREVACGVDPTGAVVRALDEFPVQRGQAWRIGVAHDDGCPSLAGGGMPACTCEIVRLEARRAA